jgi:uncharacterized protein with WD repeat
MLMHILSVYTVDAASIQNFRLVQTWNAASDGFGCVSCVEAHQSNFSRYGDLEASLPGSKMVAMTVRSSFSGAQL